MRHKIGYRKLNKTSEHRKALFKNMLNSLIKYEQIVTTLPKAKELKPQIDKVITLGKKSNLSKKKRLFSKLQDQKSVKKVFETLSKRYANRKGGYSRVLKAGFRRYIFSYFIFLFKLLFNYFCISAFNNFLVSFCF
tara:strand:- start:55 stop:462 length:408 start_codon:yes stop_codon:yes gene_type:complete